jgi:putative endonuclease
MYYMYILKDAKERYYIGSTDNLQRRLYEHNSGKTKLLKYKTPVDLVYYETFNTRSEACRREILVKKYKGGNAFKKLINNAHVAQVAEHFLGKDEVAGPSPAMG